MRAIVGLTLALILAGCGGTTVAPSPSGSKPSPSDALPSPWPPSDLRWTPPSPQGAAFQTAFCPLLDLTSEALVLEPETLATPTDVAGFREVRVQLGQLWTRASEQARALPEWDVAETLAEAMVDLTDLHLRKLEALDSFVDDETSIEELDAFDTERDELNEVIAGQRVPIICTFP